MNPLDAKIDSDLLKDEAFCKLSIPARFLYLGLLCYSNYHWDITDDPEMLNVLIFPNDPDIDINALLNELASADKPWITRGEINIMHVTPYYTDED